MAELKTLIQNTPGPILILGANGFIGWNFFLRLSEHRSDVFALASRKNWRTESSPDLSDRLYFENQGQSFQKLVESHKPALILDLAAFGAYPDQTDSERMFEVNVQRVQRNLQYLESRAGKPMYLLAGSSSEYGYHCDRATEDQASPNSLYAVTKVAASQLIQYFGKVRDLPCLHLRLFSVYGPFETASRLLPGIILRGLKQEWPELSAAGNARDFIYVDDVLSAFLMSAQKLNQVPTLTGEILNVGTGRQQSLKEVTELSRKYLNPAGAPVFGSVASRPWDQSVWVANIEKIKSQIGWQPTISFEQGFEKSIAWWKTAKPEWSEDAFAPKTDGLLSVIVAIHRDEPSIEPLYERVKKTCAEVGIEFELLFVNDRSPDQSADVIQRLSQKDSRVMGLNHAANGGSQQAFWTGLRQARGQASVLMDGDLQDPPELIKDFVEKWRQGNTVVLGRRTGRSMNPLMALGHKLFYRLARRYSGAGLPLDVGDFSLMDQQAVRQLLLHHSRDLWIRGLRAQMGFRTALVDYHRPERPFGQSTNSFRGLLSWAYKGIFLFQGEPLRRWNRFLIFIAAPACLISFALLNPEDPEVWPAFAMELLILITLAMMSEILIALYRQSLGTPRPGIESRIRNGKVEKWSL